MIEDHFEEDMAIRLAAMEFLDPLPGVTDLEETSQDLVFWLNWRADRLRLPAPEFVWSEDDAVTGIKSAPGLIDEEDAAIFRQAGIVVQNLGGAGDK